ncbi:MAG: NADH-quinone oxidoreductase subunit M [Bacteroidota bacterium]
MLVSLTIFLAALAAVLVLLLPQAMARVIALATTLGTLALAAMLYLGFDPNAVTEAMPQMAERSGAWLPGTDVTYFVGIDGLNVLLVLLVALLGPIAVGAAWGGLRDDAGDDATYGGQKGFFALMLLLQTGLLGVFCAFDLFLFYVFFEVVLIPMYFLIAIWGRDTKEQDSSRAALKFVIYTLVGSLLMLVGVLWMGYAAGNVVNGGVFTTDYYDLLRFAVPAEAQTILFVLFGLAFLIKAPLFPLHSWLPGAYRAAPLAATVLLAAVMGKMGTYGLLRFVVPMFPNAAMALAPAIGVLAAIGIVWAALVAYAQKDIKGLIAYSSVSHLGFIVLGLFAFTTEAVQGALIQMTNHALSTGALFLLAGFLYRRRGTYDLDKLGGVAKTLPALTFFTMLAVFASSGLPGLNGFVGEFLILLGAFKSTLIGPVVVGVATSGVIFAAVYLLWMAYKTFFGPAKTEADGTRDLSLGELALVLPLAVGMVWLGMGPMPFLNKSEAAVEDLLEVTASKAEMVATAEVAATQNGVPFGGAVLPWPVPQGEAEPLAEVLP